MILDKIQCQIKLEFSDWPDFKILTLLENLNFELTSELLLDSLTLHALSNFDLTLSKFDLTLSNFYLTHNLLFNLDFTYQILVSFHFVFDFKWHLVFGTWHLPLATCYLTTTSEVPNVGQFWLKKFELIFLDSRAVLFLPLPPTFFIISAIKNSFCSYFISISLKIIT